MTQISKPHPISDEALETVVGGAGQPNQPAGGMEDGVPGFDYGTPSTDDSGDDESTEAGRRGGMS